MHQNGVISAVNFACQLSSSFFLPTPADTLWILFSIWDFLASGGEENQIKNKIVAIMQEID